MERTLILTRHSIHQARSRGWQGNGKLEEQMRETVKEAIREGRVSNHKIDGFVLYGERRKMLPSRQRFVWSGDGRWGFIISREADGRDYVVTTLSRAGVYKRVH